MLSHSTHRWYSNEWNRKMHAYNRLNCLSPWLRSSKNSPLFLWCCLEKSIGFFTDINSKQGDYCVKLNKIAKIAGFSPLALGTCQKKGRSWDISVPTNSRRIGKKAFYPGFRKSSALGSWPRLSVPDPCALSVKWPGQIGGMSISVQL